MLIFFVIFFAFFISSNDGVKCYQCFEVEGKPGCRGFDVVDDELNVKSMKLNNKDWYVAECQDPPYGCTRPHVRAKFLDGNTKNVTIHACATRLLNKFLGFPDSHTLNYSACISLPIKEPPTIFSTCFCNQDKCNKDAFCEVNDNKLDSCSLQYPVYYPQLSFDILQRILDLEKLVKM